MSIFKHLFKHKHTAPTGYHPKDPPYGHLRYITTDGVNTVHASVLVKCCTCNEDFQIARLHFSAGVWDAIDKAAPRKGRQT